MIEQNAFTIIFGIFLLFTCRDVLPGQSNQDSNLDQVNRQSGVAGDHLNHHADIGSTSFDATPHMADAPGITTIRIQYCHSCGYRQAFDEISKLLQTQYPDLKVIGETHHPSWLRSQIVNLVFISKIAVLIMIYMDFNPFTYFQRETPGIWTYMSQSKVSSSLMILFIANSIESNMMSTGAFEIFYNDMPVWSKIQTGRMPSAPELAQIIQRQYALGDSSRISSFMSPRGLTP